MCMTRSYYRKGSAAFTPTALGIDYTNVQSNFKLPYIYTLQVCMNLFCLKNIEITACNNYYIYCKVYFGFSYLLYMYAHNLMMHNET
jgi:hypothetical protein